MKETPLGPDWSATLCRPAEMEALEDSGANRWTRESHTSV